MDIISFNDFKKIEIRVGKVIKVDKFPEAHKPALKLRIDFGDAIGIKKSSAQITHHYNLENLLGKNVNYSFENTAYLFHHLDCCCFWKLFV